ncbi:S-phase kinase-associated protein 2-like isoform X2 [Patiria miniata]|uniref:F-box domain-containing protein n=1 Tax=Patiria miniata TaxID=46514 RepID=A0A913ZA13_PATMI|nr:S-phase kinase-associated protein 2-like isoform X2 [Patiria miniata]
MMRRTRSGTAPTGLASVPSKPGTKPSRTNESQTSSQRSKSGSRQSHDFITPTFTWDIPKVHKQGIYNDLGVKEINVEGTVDGQQLIANKGANSKRTKKQIKDPNSAEVKGHLVSPDQFKPEQPHIHNGHSCSCKKQLQLEKPSDPFSCLSDEIMLGIFQWLPMTTLARCARVCKRWSHLVFDDSLWRRIDLSSKSFASGILGQILQRGTTAAKLSRCAIQGPVFDDVVTELPLKVTRPTSNAAKHSKSQVESSLKPTLHLQYIDLTAADTRPEQLVEILDRCPGNQIKKLSLESCTVSDDVMKLVAKHGRSLEELNLCMVSGLKEAGLKAVLKNCTKLQSLNLGWANLSRKEMDVFVENVPKSLEKLNLSGCRQMLRSVDVVLLACRCPTMKELDLSDATAIDFAAIDSITEQMTQLQHIALSRCYSIPRLSFVQLGSLKQLRAIDVFGLVQESEMLESMKELLPGVKINIYLFSAIARPTTTKKRSNIWEIMCYE